MYSLLECNLPLTHLILSNNNIEEINSSMIIKYEKHCRGVLKVLDLSNNKLNQKSLLRVLELCKSCNSLEELYLKGNIEDINKEVYIELCQVLINCNSLNTLSLEANEDTMKYLDEALIHNMSLLKWEGFKHTQYLKANLWIHSEKEVEEVPEEIKEVVNKKLALLGPQRKLNKVSPKDKAKLTIKKPEGGRSVHKIAVISETINSDIVNLKKENTQLKEQMQEVLLRLNKLEQSDTVSKDNLFVVENRNEKIVTALKHRMDIFETALKDMKEKITQNLIRKNEVERKVEEQIKSLNTILTKRIDRMQENIKKQINSMKQSKDNVVDYTKEYKGITDMLKNLPDLNSIKQKSFQAIVSIYS